MGFHRVKDFPELGAGRLFGCPNNRAHSIFRICISTTRFYPRRSCSSGLTKEAGAKSWIRFGIDLCTCLPHLGCY